MVEEDVRRELGDTMRLDVCASEDDYRKLLDGFRGCIDAFLGISQELRDPGPAAFMLRAAARASHQFAYLTERMGVSHVATEARATARAMEVLANEIEGGKASLERALPFGWR